MAIREKALKEIKELPEQILIEVYDFIKFLKHKKNNLNEWGNFALSSGAFDFWNAADEVDYNLKDLKQRR